MVVVGGFRHHDGRRGGGRLRQHRADRDAGTDRGDGLPRVVAFIAIADHDAAIPSDGGGAFLADNHCTAAADRGALDVDFFARHHGAVPPDRGIAFLAADDGATPARGGVAIFSLDGGAPRAGCRRCHHPFWPRPRGGRRALARTCAPGCPPPARLTSRTPMIFLIFRLRSS